MARSLSSKPGSVSRRTVFLWAIMLCGPLSGWCGDKPEITLKRSSREYLFFEGDVYNPGGQIPQNDDLNPSEHQTLLQNFSVHIKLGVVGKQQIPDMRFECLGVRYVLPAHRVVVLEPLPKEDGLSVVSRPDPNESGNVEVVIIYRRTGDRNDMNISLDRNQLPENMTVQTLSTSSTYNGKMYSSRLTLILRNRSDEKFVLKPGAFRNLPEYKDWPTIEIEPAPAEEAVP